MKKLIMVSMLALSACTGPLGSILTTPTAQAPAPLAKTTVDDSALLTAWKSFDAMLDAVNLYIDAKPAIIGTPGAKRLADAIDAVSAALSAAESAAAAGSTTDYLTALAHAKQALAETRMAIAALKGQ